MSPHAPRAALHVLPLLVAVLALGTCARRDVPDASLAAALRLLEDGRVWPRLAAAPAPAALARPAWDIASARVDRMLGGSNNGRWGYLLRDVDGPTWYRVRAQEPFEPASTVKMVYLLHALRAVDRGQADLTQSVNWYQGSTNEDDPATESEDEREFGCPLDTDPSVGALADGLRAMMERSDNRWTLAIRRHFGEEAIQATAREIGMVSTVLRHRIGCGYAIGTDPGQVEAPNRSTLDDLALLVEGTAAGRLLSEALVAVFLDLMANDPLIRLETVFAQEGAAAGVPPVLLEVLESRTTLAWKTGKYNIGAYKVQSVAGLARLPVYAGQGKVAWRELVFASFVDDATVFPLQGTRATLFSLAVAGELLRPAVRELLEGWAAFLREQGGLAGSSR